MCLWLWRIFVKLYLLLWKNTLHTIRRNKTKTFFDILVPVAFFLLMTISRSEYDDKRLPIDRISLHFTDNFFSPPYGPKLLPVVAYAPNNSIFDKLIKDMKNLTQYDLTYIPIDSAENLEALLKRNRSIIAGILFNHPDNISEIPQNFNFSLRFPSMMRWHNMPWPTDILYKEEAFYRFPRETLTWNFYNQEGLLTLQFRVIDVLHHIPMANWTKYGTDIVAKQFTSYPKNLNFDKFQFLFPPLVLICFYYPYLCTVCGIVVEKNKQTKEMMKLMGISSWIYWLIVYLQKILLQILLVTIVVGLMKTRFPYSKAIFENSNLYLVWIFFAAYSTCFTSLGFLLGVFFTDIKLAVSISTIIWFSSYLPFSITHIGYKIVPDHLKMILYMFPNTAMGYGIKLIFQLELMTEDGLNSSTLWNSLFPYDDILSVGVIMYVMMGTSIAFLAIFIYFIPIFPGTYGVAAPILYTFTKDFWSGKRTPQHKRPSNVDFYENEPETRTPGIQIINLTKEFVKGRAVVRNLSLNIYENEITVLCGPNGSGMTTLMLISTGMIKATSGTVLIDGYDVQKRTNSARKSIGLCPQQNILFDALTAREHILFYSLTKGSSIRTAYAEVKKYSKLLEFESELNVLASNLSAGTQRKLSLTITLCGLSKYVFLDHPTHGMDPTVRPLIWNVLINEKKGRHILMTTHSSDEVDKIADRIAFMKNGELKCCGSSNVLRKRFANYRLVCIKDDDCKSSTTTRLLDQYFPGTVIEAETKSQITYLLSYKKIHKFGRFFDKLESSYVSQLNLKSYSVALIVTEFLFNEFTDYSERDDLSIKSLHIQDQNNIQCMCRMALIPFQLTAILMKRFLCGIRNWRSFILYNLIPIILLVPIAYDLNLRTVMQKTNPPPFELSLASYEDSHCFFETSDHPGKANKTIIIAKNISDGYDRMFESERNPLIKLNTSELLTYGQQFGVQKYRFNFLIGASTNKYRHIWANTFSALHTVPISLKYLLSSRIYPKINITVINEPVHSDETINIAATEYKNMEVLGIDFPIFIAIVMAIISSVHIVFYIKENQSRQKIKQYVNGVNHFIFWVTSIVWDSCISIVSILAIVLWLYLSERAFWSEINTLYIVASTLFLFNLAMMPIICLLSLMFSSMATGICVLNGVQMFIAMILFVNNYGVEFIPQDTLIKQAMSVIPTCALIQCLKKLSTIGKKCGNQCDDVCDSDERERLCDENPDCCPQFSLIWNDDDIRTEILFMACTAAVALIILLVVEHEISKQLISYGWNFILRPTSTMKNVESDSEDDESESEDSINKLIGNGEQESTSCCPKKCDKIEEKVTMFMVSKYYGCRLAVDRISLYMKSGECVGMIGKNGMGKTTIFKMLTGEERICYGKAYLLEFNLKWSTRKTHDFVGYCPQIDGLWDEFSVCQTLRFFCLLRGAEFTQASDMAKSLNLGQHFSQNVSKLSGGNKQILSIVIALIGCPNVILLDTATTCIDVKTKRKLWDILNKFRDAGKSILLASDCIEEYQTLCTRFIADEGTDASVLKNEPSSIELQFESFMAEYETNNVGIIEFMKVTFKEAQFRSSHKNFVTYDIPYTMSMLSKLFIAIEKRRRPLCIENYYISVK